VVPRGTRIVFCRFDFAVIPLRGPVTTEWTGPGGSSERVVRPRALRAAGFARSRGGGALDSGRYTCTLRVAGVRLAAVSIRVR